MGSLISSNIVMRVCRNALKERMPQHVKEYLKNLADGGRAESISNFNEYENNEKKKDVFNELNSNEKISRINDSRSSNTTNNL